MLVLRPRGQKPRKPRLFWLPLSRFVGVSRLFWNISIPPCRGLAAHDKEVMRLSLAMLLRSEHLSAQNGINSRLITATKRA